jgi:hypothetical protein
MLACNKNSIPPTNSGTTTHNIADTGKEGDYPSTITVLINGAPMQVTSIGYNRGDGFFNFSAMNSLQKVDVNCFWFYQQSRWSFQYSDSINYSTRPDSLTQWQSIRASNYGTVNFDCCDAPLTDSLVEGEYAGTFLQGKATLNIGGDFHLVFQ